MFCEIVKLQLGHLKTSVSGSKIALSNNKPKSKAANPVQFIFFSPKQLSPRQLKPQEGHHQKSGKCRWLFQELDYLLIAPNKVKQPLRLTQITKEAVAYYMLL